MPSALFQRKKHFPNYLPSKPQLIKNISEYVESSMKMGNLIYTSCFSSKGSSHVRIADSSILNIPAIPMYVMENTNHASPPQTPRHISRRTEITANGVVFRSTEDLLEGGQQTDDDATTAPLNAALYEETLLKSSKPEIRRRTLSSYHNIKANIERLFQKAPEPWTPPFQLSSFTRVPDEMQEWADDYFGRGAAARPGKTDEYHRRRVIVGRGRQCGLVRLAHIIILADTWTSILGFTQTKRNITSSMMSHRNILRLSTGKNLLGPKKTGSQIANTESQFKLKEGSHQSCSAIQARGPAIKISLTKRKMLRLKSWTLHNAKFIFLDSPLYQTSTQDCEKESNSDGDGFTSSAAAPYTSTSTA
ncbi:replication-associated protein [Sidastrum golden leaf spot virus]|uniref:Replication-associated protein n=1 Tax=Sidastrum golden leaf spot virus TaxID=858513 RepID=E9KZK5_9GEMI|nr:replication-associated protein [Sidastrum golden leaf spot virus]ADW10640.1 replication-associated protein [Sidastrum golden leaf spot virus]